MNSSLLSLPDEILILIAEFTPVGDLRHLRLVCKRLLAIYGATLLPLNNLLAQQSRELLHHPGSTRRNVHHIRAEHDALNHNWFRLATDLDPDLGLEEGAKTKFYFNPFSRSHILFEDDLALLCRNIRFSAGWALEVWRMPNEEDLPKTSNKLLFTHQSAHWGEPTPLHETLNDFHFDPRQKLLVTVQTIIIELPEPIFTATMPRLPPSASLYKSLPESPVDDRTDPFLSVKIEKPSLDNQTQESALQLDVVPQLSSLPALELGPELSLDPVPSTPVEVPSKGEQVLSNAEEKDEEVAHDTDSMKEGLISHYSVVLDALQESSKVLEELNLNTDLSPPPVDSGDPSFDMLEVEPLEATQGSNNEVQGADSYETHMGWVISAAASQQPEPWVVPLPNSRAPTPQAHLTPLPDSPPGTPDPLVTPLPNSPTPVVQPELESPPVVVRPEPRPPPMRRHAYQVIRVHDLFKGGPHPDAVPYASKADRARWAAANPDVKTTGKEDVVEVEEEFRYWKGLAYAVSEAERPHVQVVGDLVLFRSIDQFKGSYLLIWNWKTKAKQVLWFQEKAINYTILSHDTILVCCFNGEKRQPLLKVFSNAVLPTGQESPVPATPSTTSSPPPRPALPPWAAPEFRQWTHRATFAMPNLTQEGANSLNDMWLWCTPIQRLRSDASVLASDMPHLRTQPCPEQALVFLRTRWHFQPPMAVFAMKRSTFLDAVHPQTEGHDPALSPQTVRPWSSWGPKNTRLLPASHLVKAARGPTPSCHGSRIITLLDKSKNEGHHETDDDTAAIKRSASVLDFSTATVEWALSDEGKAAGVKYVDVDRDYDQYKADDHKGKGKEKPGPIEEKEEIGTVTERLLHLGSTARQVRGLEQVVETHLPYYEVVSDMVPRNVLELRVDDKRVFVATKDAEDPDSAMVVWPMWSRATA